MFNEEDTHTHKETYDFLCIERDKESKHQIK